MEVELIDTYLTATFIARTIHTRSRAVVSPTVVTAIGYLIALALAELAGVSVDARIGLPVDAAILIALLSHGAKSPTEPERALLWSLAVVPIIRILSLSLPTTAYPLTFWYVLVAVPMLAATFTAANALGYAYRDLGLVPRLSSVPRDFALIPIGSLLGFVDYLILRPQPLIHSQAPGELWMPAVVLALATGLAEELVFRGLLQRAAVDLLGRGGCIYVAVLYASMTLGDSSVVHVAFTFLTSLAFSWAVIRGGSVLGASLGHASLNVTLFLIAPFLPGLSAAEPLLALRLVVILALGIGVLEMTSHLPLARPGDECYLGPLTGSDGTASAPVDDHHGSVNCRDGNGQRRPESSSDPFSDVQTPLDHENVVISGSGDAGKAGTGEADERSGRNLQQRRRGNDHEGDPKRNETDVHAP